MYEKQIKDVARLCREVIQLGEEVLAEHAERKAFNDKHNYYTSPNIGGTYLAGDYKRRMMDLQRAMQKLRKP